ncbi:MAG: SRPBCC domain-containing protein [Verrucomicrobia bacterium]|nr:SRPBCC domain-containing protein [Verrucomicrobiota bacterium]
MDSKLSGLMCFVCGLAVAGMTTATAADTFLPSITVTGRATPSPTPAGDMVSRDRQQRSPEVRWPSVISKFINYLEVFAHNEIDINASAQTVWSHLVQAKLWSQWCSFAKKVKIWGGSEVLEKNSRFLYMAYDLPQDRVLLEVPPEPMSSKVFEYVPESRLGWRGYGAPTIQGALCETYHYWLLEPVGPNRTRIVFEEVATGWVARFARGNYPEVVHVGHDQWLEELKKVSETKR